MLFDCVLFDVSFCVDAVECCLIVFCLIFHSVLTLFYAFLFLMLYDVV
jgi:hypothetical protein